MKKLSTLMAGALLVTSVSAFADHDNETAYRDLSVFADTWGTDGKSNDKKVTEIKSNEWYQLEVGTINSKDSVLVQLRDYESGELHLEVVALDSLVWNNAGKGKTVGDGQPTLNSSLWKIEVVDKTPGAYLYTFINKETGYSISYNCDEAYKVKATDLMSTGSFINEPADYKNNVNKSDVNAWRWYTFDSTDDETNGLVSTKLYAFNHDNTLVYGLAQDNDKKVSLVSIEPKAVSNGTNMVEKFNILSLAVRRAGARVLTAADFNSMIDADGDWKDDYTGGRATREGAKLTGVKNDLTDGSYVAKQLEMGVTDLEDFIGYNLLLKKVGKVGVYFGVETDSTYEYDRLPSDYQHLVVHDKLFGTENDTIPGKSVTELSDLKAYDARFVWKVTYYPTQDSLVFEPLNASLINDYDKGKDNVWSSTALKGEGPKQWYNTINACAGGGNNNSGSKAGVGGRQQKAAGIPVALTTANNNGIIDATSAVLTVGKPYKTVTGAAKKTGYGRVNETNVTAQMGLKIQFNHTYTTMTRSTATDGLYFIQIKVDNSAKTDYRKDGKYLVMNMWGQMMYDSPDDYQNYLHMPATQWVIEQDTCALNGTEAYVKVYNREYGASGSCAFAGQLYVDGNGNKYIINHENYNYVSDSDGKFGTNKFSCGDTLKLTEITDKAVKGNAHLGYKYFDAAALDYETWGIKYSNANTYGNLNTDNYLNVNEDDSLLVIEKDMYKDYEISPIKTYTYGYKGGAKTGLAQLSRTVYTLKVRDNNLIDNPWQYVVVKEDSKGNPYYQTAHLKDVDGKNVKLATFYFKADQITKEGDTAYVFVDATGYKAGAPATQESWATFTGVLDSKYSDNAQYAERTYSGNGWKQLGVKSQTAKTTYMTLDTDPETVNDAFIFVQDNRPKYMPIGVDVTDGVMNTTVNIFRTRGNASIASVAEYLFEDGNNQSGVAESSIVKNFGYLGISTENAIKPVGKDKTTALYVDSVIKSNPRMPQYLFMVDVDSVADGRWCETNVHGYFPTKDIANDKDSTHHKFYNGYVAGRVLVNLNDSVAKYEGINMLDSARKFTYENYTRLGFVEAVHMYVDSVPTDAAFNLATGEYLFIMKGGFALDSLIAKVGDYAVIDANKFNEALKAGKMDQKTLDGKHKNYAFSLRYTDDDHKDVLLESQNSENEATIGTFSAASWVKIHNNVPVLAQSTSLNGDHTAIESNTTLSELIAQAQIFNLGATDETATANEEIAAEGVKVIAGEGFVTVKGAAGKKVVIANILGQTVANTVVSSDEAQIAAPAGVVVVAVEGEAAQKAIVK